MTITATIVIENIEKVFLMRDEKAKQYTHSEDLG